MPCMDRRQGRDTVLRVDQCPGPMQKTRSLGVAGSTLMHANGESGPQVAEHSGHTGPTL